MKRTPPTTTIHRQCLSKGKTDEQFLRGIRHFRLELTTVRKGDNDDGLFLSIDEKVRSAHQKNRHEGERDDTFLFLSPIARR